MIGALRLHQLAEHDIPAAMLVNPRQRQLDGQRFTAQVFLELLAVVTKIQEEVRRLGRRPETDVCQTVQDALAVMLWFDPGRIGDGAAIALTRSPADFAVASARNCPW